VSTTIRICDTKVSKGNDEEHVDRFSSMY
jgi:hypothetical protein